MLRKLIKYDLKWSLKIISIYYIIGVIAAIIGRLFDFLPNSTFFDIIGKIIKGASLSLTITGLINCIIRSWVRLIHNMYKDESYLTHTIPTNRSNHYLSKIISTLIALLLSFIVLVANIVIMYLSKDNIESLKTLFNMFDNFYEGRLLGVIVLLVALLLIEVIFIVLCGFFAIIYGYSFESGKLGKSVIVGLIVYGITNTISLGVMLATTIFSDGLYKVIFELSQTVDFKLFIVLLLISFLLYLIYCFILFVMSNLKLKKGVNVE